MRLIKKYDVFIPGEEINTVVNAGSSTAVHAGILTLLRTAFALGREAERSERIEETTDNEGGIVNIVRSK